MASVLKGRSYVAVWDFVEKKWTKNGEGNELTGSHAEIRDAWNRSRPRELQEATIQNIKGVCKQMRAKLPNVGGPNVVPHIALCKMVSTTYSTVSTSSRAGTGPCLSSPAMPEDLERIIRYLESIDSRLAALERDRVMSSREVCESLGVHRDTLRSYWQTGKIPAPVRLGHRDTWTRAQVREMPEQIRRMDGRGRRRS